MTGQKKTAVDSRRAGSSRGNPVGPDWREFTCLPLKHMVAWKSYAAANPEERAWIQRVGLEGFVNLPWGQPIRKDVVENFINTAQSTKQQSIIGEVMGRTYVITPVDITNILRLPTGTTTEVNTNRIRRSSSTGASVPTAMKPFTDPIPTATVFPWEPRS